MTIRRPNPSNQNPTDNNAAPLDDINVQVTTDEISAFCADNYNTVSFGIKPDSFVELDKITPEKDLSNNYKTSTCSIKPQSPMKQQ